MSAVSFTANCPEDRIIRLPDTVSRALPSRGTVMVNGKIENIAFQSALEPDGEGGHWFKIPRDLYLSLPQQITCSLEATKVWPEPHIPQAIAKALDGNPAAYVQWSSTTPMARWEWIRWYESVKQEATLQERPAKLCALLTSGKRRPCCFNRALKTPPKEAILI